MTSITLDTPTTGGPPAVKFPKVGTSVVVGIVKVKDYQQHSIDGVPQTWSDNSPRLGKLVTGLVVSSNGATVDDRPAEPGDLVTFWCEKGRFLAYDAAKKKHGKVNVGDVMQWVFESEEPATQRGYNPRKVYVAAIRSPKPEDGDLADRCAAAYHELEDRPTVDAPTAPVSAAQAAESFGATVDTESPF